MREQGNKVVRFGLDGYSFSVKYNNLSAFENHLLSASPDHFADVYLIICKEEFERESALKSLKEQILKNERTPNLCYKVFDGESLAISGLLNELNTLPFLSKNKVVAVRRVDKLNKAHLKLLEGYFAEPGRRIKLIMTASEIAANTTFYRKAELSGILLDIPQKKGFAKEGELAEWAIRYCAQQGKQIDRRVAQMLVKQLGDGSLLPQELEKLCCYVGDRKECRSEDVAAICSMIPSETIWQLGEAILRRDIASALRAGRGLLSTGEALLAVVAQIRYQLQTSYQIATLLAKGMTQHEIAPSFPRLVGGLLDKQCGLASAYGLERFRESLIALADTEFKAKDSAADPEFLFERLLFKLVGL